MTIIEDSRVEALRGKKICDVAKVGRKSYEVMYVAPIDIRGERCIMYHVKDKRGVLTFILIFDETVDAGETA